MSTLLESVDRMFQMLGPHVIRELLIYPWRKANAEAKWTLSGHRRYGPQRWLAFVQALTGSQPSWPETWTEPGPVRMIRPTERGAIADTDRGAIEISLFAPDLVRVHYRRTGRSDRTPPYAIAKPLWHWPTPDFAAIQWDGAYLLQTTDLIVGLWLKTGRLFFATPAGDLLRADMDLAYGEDGSVRHRAALAADERLFGLGERATAWNRRGRTHVLWNSDPSGYREGDDPINLNLPVYMGVVPGDGGTHSYMVFYDNAYYSEFDLGEHAASVADHRFVGGELRYYFGTGTAPQLLERYTELTGRHPLQPLWMLGYQQSRWSYETEARIRKLAADFDTHKVPCDAIYMDIDYMDAFRCFTWNRGNFPDLKQLAGDLHAQGTKLVSMIDPAIKQDLGNDVYREGARRGYFCTTPDGRIFHAPVWAGASGFPDFTDPDVRDWWGPLYRPLIEAGIAGFWNDMNEPTAFGAFGDRTLPQTVRHSLEGIGGNHRAAHNVYGMQMVRATRQGLKALAPDRRPVVITRAGWAGVQRYATSWTADNASTWSSLRLTIPMVMALGLSGLGFTGADVGGFAGSATGELFTRWVQMGAFMPYFRTHTAKGDPDQEPWSYGEPYLSIVRRFIELRYELLPYLYTAVWQMSTRGWPMVRPLAWCDSDTPALWDVDDAFLCGDHILVAPIVTPDTTSREVHLPPGAWYDFWTNHIHAGDRVTEFFAPLESLPLLVREGAILTMGEAGPNVEQRRQKFLRLSVYPLTAPGEAVTELYEDTGEGPAYQDGEQRVSRLGMTRDDAALTITWQREGSYVPPYEHLELTLNGLQRAPRAIEVDGEVYTMVTADPVRRTVLLGIPPFDELRITL